MTAVKYLRVEAKSDYYDDSSETFVEVREVTPQEILNEHSNDLTYRPEVFTKDPKTGQFDKSACKKLTAMGWVHADTAKKADDKKVLEDRFYIVHSSYGKYYGQIRPFDYQRMDSYEADSLANGGMLVQRVSPKSVLPPDQYKKYAAAVKVIEDRERQKREAAEKRKEKTKAKRVAAALKTLEDAGVKVKPEDSAEG